MEKTYHIGRIASLKAELRQLVHDLHNGKVANATAADVIITLRDELDRMLGDINYIEHN